MEFRQLEFFLACCDRGTFTAAARSMHVVQSAISTSIAKLEHELGVALFDRTSTSLVLTDAGRAIVEPARAALRSRGEVRGAVERLHGEIRGEVALGALVNIVTTIDLARAFGVVHQRHPGITIAMRQNPQGSEGNIRAIRDGLLDLGLLGGPVPEVPGITAYRLADDPLVLVGAPDHPLVRAGHFAAADLADERTIDYPPGWGTRTVVDAEIPRRRSVIEVADQHFGIQLALTGFGLTLVPGSVARADSRIAASTCTDRRLDWSISIAHSASRAPSAATRTVLDIVRETTATG